MAKSNKSTPKVNHRFVGVREVVLNPSTGTGAITFPMPVASNAGGTGNGATVLTSIGLAGVTFSGGAYFNPASGVANILRPALRGMYNRALDFQWYRVTRAKLVFVGSVGSTAVGTITLAAYTDAIDVAAQTIATVISGPNTKTFDIATSSSKELSVPIPVDTSWKKVSSVLTVPANSYPFTAADATSFVVLNTINDLSFGSIQWTCTGAGNAQALGSLYVDYDVEYKSPIDTSVNF